MQEHLALGSQELIGSEKGKVMNDYQLKYIELKKEYEKSDGNVDSVQGYLFRCLHCGKHLLWADCD